MCRLLRRHVTDVPSRIFWLQIRKRRSYSSVCHAVSFCSAKASECTDRGLPGLRININRRSYSPLPNQLGLWPSYERNHRKTCVHFDEVRILAIFRLAVVLFWVAIAVGTSGLIPDSFQCCIELANTKLDKLWRALERFLGAQRWQNENLR